MVVEGPPKQVSEAVEQVQKMAEPTQHIGLQEFLDIAGIHFMDLTTTKRRLTTAPTPSKMRQQPGPDQDNSAVDLKTAVVAGGCTGPELEMYEHACHELRRYISDGKKVIKELEAQTAKDNPPLMQAYMSGDRQEQGAIDAQMRDIKSNARLRSKEMWYAWRSQLLDDLMKGLQSIGEGLIRDDEVLQQLEEVVDNVVPGLIGVHGKLQMEAEMLEQENAAMNEDEKEQLDPARENLQQVSQKVADRQEELARLRREVEGLDLSIGDLQETRTEFLSAIKEADRVKEACRGISLTEINDLKGISPFPEF